MKHLDKTAQIIWEKNTIYQHNRSQPIVRRVTKLDNILASSVANILLAVETPLISEKLFKVNFFNILCILKPIFTKIFRTGTKLLEILL